MPPSLDRIEERLDNTEEDVAGLTGAVLRIEAAVVDLKLSAARREGETARMSAGLSFAAAVVVAGITLLGQYILRPADPKPTQAPTHQLSAEDLEQLRLLQQRDGYRLGQQAPAENTPQP